MGGLGRVSTVASIAGSISSRGASCVATISTLAPSRRVPQLAQNRARGSLACPQVWQNCCVIDVSPKILSSHQKVGENPAKVQLDNVLFAESCKFIRRYSQ